jgi:Holliday junction resolvasome RuvABC endonuclease subunit
MNVMGVDLGVHKVAVFGWDDEIAYAHAYVTELTYKREDQLRQLAGLVHDAATLHDADVVWIEDTLVGNNVKYSMALAEVKGAVMASLASHSDVRLVNVGTWKKGTVGAGNANKDSIRDYIHVSNGPYAPLCGDDQDLYDACCIAIYGRSVMERARDLRLVPGQLADEDEPGSP